MLPDQTFDPPQLMTREAKVERDPYWCKPKLCRHILTVYVNVGRLPSIVTREVNFIRSFDPDARHILSSTSEEVSSTDCGFCVGLTSL